MSRRRAETERLIPVIQEKLEAGLRPKEIAEQMGKTRQWVYMTIQRNPELELTPKRDAWRKVLAVRGTTYGSVGNAIANSSPEFKMWLIKNTPDGASLADTLVACAADAFNDETSAPLGV